MDLAWCIIPNQDWTIHRTSKTIVSFQDPKKKSNAPQKTSKNQNQKNKQKEKALFHLEDSLVGWLFIAIAGLADKYKAVQKQQQ